MSVKKISGACFSQKKFFIKTITKLTMNNDIIVSLLSLGFLKIASSMRLALYLPQLI